MRNITLISLGLLVITFSIGCTKMQSASSGGANNSSSTGTPVTPQEKVPHRAFMSAEQMLKAMISTTGTEGLGELTDPADDLINNTFVQRSGALPSSNALSSATGPTLISAANIAASVCAKAVDRDRATGEAQRDTRLFFKEFDFSKGLAAQDSSAVTKAFSRIARNSWRRDTTADEQTAIVDFSQEFSTGANTTDVAQTRYLAISICTAVLSSIDGLSF